MATLGSLGSFTFTYGAVDTANREVEFQKSPNGENVVAITWQISPGGTRLNRLSTIFARDITIQMQSYSTSTLRAALGLEPDGNRTLSSFSTKHQIAFASSFPNRNIKQQISIGFDTGGAEEIHFFPT